MKPANDALTIVTCTVDPVRAKDCLASWLGRARYHLPVVIVWTRLPPAPPLTTKQQARELAEYYQLGTNTLLQHLTPGLTIIDRVVGGVVPAFAQGVAAAFADGAQAVVALHDDVLIEEDGWDVTVQTAIDHGTRFAGFGGSPSLGSAELYRTPYDPMQLARGEFLSNMRDAEAHGRRVRSGVRCVVFDGFCQIGTRDWFGAAWQHIAALGVVHHLYDGLLACEAQRVGVQPGMLLPVACHHYGGQTAVGSAAYQQWANATHIDGDQGFWHDAHWIGYEAYRDVLPLRVPA